MRKTLAYPNERLQLNDYQAVMAEVLSELMRSHRITLIPSGRVPTPAAALFAGFNTSVPVGGTVVLYRGAGIFPLYLDGEIIYGLLAGEEDPASYILDLSALGNNVYAIYVRLIYGQTDDENRVFWNAGGSPAEYIDSVPTRDTPSWEYVIQASSVAPPGRGEWAKLWEATVVAGAITVMTDRRHFFFEGQVQGSYPADWGDGTNDRNANRALYGVQDFHKAWALARRQLSDIIGDKHYSAVPRNLTELASEHDVGGYHGNVIAKSVGIGTDPGVGDSGYSFYLNAIFGVIVSTLRGYKIHGHRTHPHEFFDDFFYVGGGAGSANLLHEQVANMPWGFRGVGGGILGSANNYAFAMAEKGGVIRLHAENVANRGIDMISGFNANAASFKGWWNLEYPLCSAMFRFKTPANITEWGIIFGLVVAGDFAAQPSAYVRYVDDSGGGGTGGKLQAQVKGAAVVGASVDLITLAAATWYTLRIWYKNTTTISFQVNNGAAIDAQVNPGDAIQSGAYDLFVRNVVSTAPAGARDLAVDQAFAIDGNLDSDMG